MGEDRMRLKLKNREQEGKKFIEEFLLYTIREEITVFLKKKQ